MKIGNLDEGTIEKDKKLCEWDISEVRKFRKDDFFLVTRKRIFKDIVRKSCLKLQNGSFIS